MTFEKGGARLTDVSSFENFQNVQIFENFGNFQEKIKIFIILKIILMSLIAQRGEKRWKGFSASTLADVNHVKKGGKVFLRARSLMYIMLTKVEMFFWAHSLVQIVSKKVERFFCEHSRRCKLC